MIVFQTYGAKEWEVHDDAGAHQVMMTPGTSMYLPTGTPHMARTQATASLHVTVGINRYVWRDLVQKVIDPVLASKDLDGALPAELFHDKHALAEALRAKVEDVVRRGREAAVVEVVAEGAMHTVRVAIGAAEPARLTCGSAQASSAPHYHVEALGG